MIYKLFSTWGPKNFHTRTRISDIAICVWSFCLHNVGFTTEATHTHKHTQTHVGVPYFMWTFHRYNAFYTVQLYIFYPHHRKHSASLHLQQQQQK